MLIKSTFIVVYLIKPFFIPVAKKYKFKYLLYGRKIHPRATPKDII